MPNLGMLARRFCTSAIRRSHDMGGVPGGNLPFDINNPLRFTIVYTIFLSTGLAVPFIIVRHQLLKQ